MTEEQLAQAIRERLAWQRNDVGVMFGYNCTLVVTESHLSFNQQLAIRAVIEEIKTRTLQHFGMVRFI